MDLHIGDILWGLLNYIIVGMIIVLIVNYVKKKSK